MALPPFAAQFADTKWCEAFDAAVVTSASGERRTAPYTSAHFGPRPPSGPTVYDVTLVTPSHA